MGVEVGCRIIGLGHKTRMILRPPERLYRHLLALDLGQVLGRGAGQEDIAQVDGSVRHGLDVFS
jgi:hypothetical protein